MQEQRLQLAARLSAAGCHASRSAATRRRGARAGTHDKRPQLPVQLRPKPHSISARLHGRGAAAAARSRNGMGIGNKIVKQARKQKQTAEPSASATRGKRSRPRQLGKKVTRETRGKKRGEAGALLRLHSPYGTLSGEREESAARQPGSQAGRSGRAAQQAPVAHSDSSHRRCGSSGQLRQKERARHTHAAGVQTEKMKGRGHRREGAAQFAVAASCAARSSAQPLPAPPQQPSPRAALPSHTACTVALALIVRHHRHHHHANCYWRGWLADRQAG